MLVGSFVEDTAGAAWTFELATGAVRLTLQRDALPPSVQDLFGAHVAASTRLLAVTSNQGVHLFEQIAEISGLFRARVS